MEEPPVFPKKTNYIDRMKWGFFPTHSQVFFFSLSINGFVHRRQQPDDPDRHWRFRSGTFYTPSMVCHWDGQWDCLDLPEGIRDLSADPAPWSDGLPCNTWSQGRDSPPSGDRPAGLWPGTWSLLTQAMAIGYGGLLSRFLRLSANQQIVRFGGWFTTISPATAQLPRMEANHNKSRVPENTKKKGTCLKCLGTPSRSRVSLTNLLSRKTRKLDVYIIFIYLLYPNLRKYGRVQNNISQGLMVNFFLIWGPSPLPEQLPILLAIPSHCWLNHEKFAEHPISSYFIYNIHCT